MGVDSGELEPLVSEPEASPDMASDAPPKSPNPAVAWASPLAQASFYGYAAFAGGQRLRSRLVVEVALALGDPHPDVTDAASTALELLQRHARADRAAIAEGATTDEAAARLVAHALQGLESATQSDPHRLAQLRRTLDAAHLGEAPRGQHPASLVEALDRDRERTTALFEAAGALGAISAGADPRPWQVLGERMSRAFQRAVDLARIGDQRQPDAALDALLAEASAAVPPCPRRDRLDAWIQDRSLSILSLGSF